MGGLSSNDQDVNQLVLQTQRRAFTGQPPHPRAVGQSPGVCQVFLRQPTRQFLTAQNFTLQVREAG